MKLDQATSPELVAFTTREFARLENISIAAASRRLARLQRTDGSLVQLTRGVWTNTAHPGFSPLACVPVLVGGEQGYVSFLTALHIHGAISQIPASIQVATTGHTRQLCTPIGTFEFLQLKPEMFADGVDWSDSAYRLATLEKALLDTFYISTRKKRRFSRLPELDLDEAGFSERRYRALLKRHELSRQIGAAMESRLEAVLGRTSAESGQG